MSDLNIDVGSLNRAREAAVKKLFQTRSESNTNDELTGVLTQSRADKVKLTQHMLKKRLAHELDQTIAAHVDDHPEMKGNFYVGILSGKSLEVEVVSMDTAIGAVTDMAPEEAEAILRANPVGYFKADDFTLKSSDDPAYKSLGSKIKSFVAKNQEIMQFLRNSPAGESKDSDFYSVPR